MAKYGFVELFFILKML